MRNDPRHRKSLLSLGLLVALVLLLGSAKGCPLPHGELAIAEGNTLKVVDPYDNRIVTQVDRYFEVGDLAYRPDGERLAMATCTGDRIVELETGKYSEVAVAMTADSCPWDLEYGPAGEMLVANLPFRKDPMGAMFGKLKVVGQMPVDMELGRPLPAVTCRPDGAELAVATPGEVKILAPKSGYRQTHNLAGLNATALAYTLDNSRLVAGTARGFEVRDATAGYATLHTNTGGEVVDVVMDPKQRWIAFVREREVSIRHFSSLRQIRRISTQERFVDADFSPDGVVLAVAEDGRVRLFRTGIWTEATPIAGGRHSIKSVAYKPS